MSIFQTIEGFTRHVNGVTIKCTGDKYFNISTTYDNCRFPDEHQNVCSVVLTVDALNSLIIELQKIANENV